MKTKKTLLLAVISLLFIFASYHTDEKTTGVHVPYRWVWADSTARVGTAITQRDTLKVGLQLDHWSEWMLADSPAVWKNVGGKNRHEVDTIFTIGLRVGVTGSTIDSIAVIDGAADTLVISVGAKNWKFLPVANQ